MRFINKESMRFINIEDSNNQKHFNPCLSSKFPPPLKRIFFQSFFPKIDIYSIRCRIVFVIVNLKVFKTTFRI